MARPVKCRCIECRPPALRFAPRGIAPRGEVCLCLDELEAVRLADAEGLYHEQAADCMKVSRATFGRILGRAHAKLAEAVLRGKALRIETDPGRVRRPVKKAE